MNEIAKVAAITGDNAPVLRHRPPLFPPHRGGNAARRPQQIQKRPRLGARNSLDEMVQEMVAYDLSKAKQHALLKAQGFEVGVER